MVGREIDIAVLEHAIVRLNGVVVGHSDAVFALELAVRQVWISSDASIRQWSFRVVQIHDVQVERSELSRVDFEVAKYTCSFEQCSYVSTADIAASIDWLKTRVLPSVHLGHGHNIKNAHALLGGQFRNFTDVLVCNIQSEVEGL